MIIYVEGVDGSGKTILVNKLHEIYGYEIVPIPQRQEDKIKELQDWRIFVKNHYGHTVLCDRSFISELVYRLHDNDKTFLNLIDMANWLGDCKFIHCISKSSFVDANTRGEDNIVTFEAHKEIEQWYEIIFKILNKFTHIPIMKFDWTIDNSQDIVKFINSKVEVF